MLPRTTARWSRWSFRPTTHRSLSSNLKPILVLIAPQVTIVPREKYPLGQTVVKANEQRELTQLFTRRYLEEQLLTVLAGKNDLIYLGNTSLIYKVLHGAT